MAHNRANRVRQLEEQLHLAQVGRANALDERDQALAELAALKASQKHERQTATIISRVYDEAALQEAREAARRYFNYITETDLPDQEYTDAELGRYPWLRDASPQTGTDWEQNGGLATPVSCLKG